MTRGPCSAANLVALLFAAGLPVAATAQTPGATPRGSPIGKLEDASATTSTVQGSTFQAEQGGDDSKLEGSIAWRKGSDIWGIKLRTAKPRSSKGNIFDVDSGLYNGASVGVRYTWYSFYGPPRLRSSLRPEFADCTCYQEGLNVGEPPNEALEKTCKSLIPDWEYTPPADGAPSCGGPDDSSDVLLFAGASAGGVAIKYRDPADGLEEKDSKEASYKLEAGIAGLPHASTLFGFTVAFEREAKAPKSKPDVCTPNAPVFAEFTRCEEAYLEKASTSRLLTAELEMRQHLSARWSIRPAVKLTVLKGDDRLPYFDADVLFYYTAGDKNPLHLGVRPRLRSPLSDDEGDAEFDVSVFLGGAFRVVDI